MRLHSYPNHSLRAFFFAELIAKAKGLQYDAEVIYVAAILHDTDLTASHMSVKQRFEVDGANLAREIAGRHSISKARADLMWGAIALHDQGGIARWKAVEVMLLNAGVAADFGAYLDLMKREDIVAVLSAAPRTGFIPVFRPVRRLPLSHELAPKLQADASPIKQIVLVAKDA